MSFIRRHVFFGFLAVAAMTNSLKANEQDEPRFILPIDCAVNETCFLQNLIDLDPSGSVLDTFCEQNTYNGHKGIDIRVRTLREMKAGIRVFAMADGIVGGTRNDMSDRLVETKDQAEQVRGRECGNGVVVRHSKKQSTQYCHMKQGSVRVKKGDLIRQGDVLGEIGVSGFSAFPHLHVTWRSGKGLLDLLSGQEVTASTSCRRLALDGGVGPFGGDVRDALLTSRNAVIGIGLADRTFPLSDLVHGRQPAVPTSLSKAVVGWGWVINGQTGDRMRIRIENEEGVFSDQIGKPLDRHKAAYVNLAGRRRVPKPGFYKVSISVIRDGRSVLEKTEIFQVK